MNEIRVFLAAERYKLYIFKYPENCVYILSYLLQNCKMLFLFHISITHF